MVKTSVTILHPDELSEPIQKHLGELIEMYPDIDINFDRELIDDDEPTNEEWNPQEEQ